MKNNSPLYKMRTGKGYTMKYMAEKLGISLTAYARYERGKTKISLERIKQLSDVLGMSEQEFLQKVMPESELCSNNSLLIFKEETLQRAQNQQSLKNIYEILRQMRPDNIITHQVQSNLFIEIHKLISQYTFD